MIKLASSWPELLCQHCLSQRHLRVGREFSLLKSEVWLWTKLSRHTSVPEQAEGLEDWLYFLKGPNHQDKCPYQALRLGWSPTWRERVCRAVAPGSCFCSFLRCLGVCPFWFLVDHWGFESRLWSCPGVLWFLVKVLLVCSQSTKPPISNSVSASRHWKVTCKAGKEGNLKVQCSHKNRTQ